MNILELAILKKMVGGGGGSGTDNYNDLSNLPKINDTTLSGNKTSANLGLQSEINSDSKLASDLVDDTNQDNKFVTSTEKNTWNAKQNAIDADHKLNADYVDDSTSTNKFVTSSDKETWNAKQNAIDADHKLSSSLVSFTTAEAAALASGIGSAKVAQISTNQSNILLVEDMVCATEFSSSTAYAVGDMVTYEHKLYKFINAHQGAWSASDVQNYDLTRLEAEDRASLAEVVDSGAKNLLQLPSGSATSCGITFSCDPSTGIVTANGTKQDGDCFMLLATISLTSFPRKFVAFCNNIDNAKVCITIVPHRTNGTYASTIVIGTYTTIDLTSSVFDSFLIRVASYADTGATLRDEKIYPMLCTKAAFGVSQKFVPYRLPYDDVQSKTTLLMNNMGGLTFHGSDLNTLVAGGRYLVNNASDNPVSNAPYNSWQTVEVFQSDYSTYPKVYYQIATDVTGATVTSKWRRRVYNSGGQYNAWTAWSS